MNSYRYLIILMAIMNVVLGDQMYLGQRQRLRPKFRPKQEWFSEMMQQQPKAEPAVIYDEEMQGDQPAIQYNNDSPFQDFYVDDIEINEGGGTAVEGGGKFLRTVMPAKVYQNLCPIKNRTVYVNQTEQYDSRFIYKPDRFVNVECLNPKSYHSRYQQDDDKICRSHGFECIQIKNSVNVFRRLRSDPDKNCWQPDLITIDSGCHCMWPKHIHGDILRHHILLDDE